MSRLPDTREARVVSRILDRPEDTLRLVMAGDEFDTWRVGDGLVVKFPRNEWHAAKVPIEIALHPLLRERLGDLVPAIRLVGEAGRRFPFPFVGFEPAAGEQGQTVDGRMVAAGPGLAVDLATTLRRLHEVDGTTAVRAGAGHRSPIPVVPAIDRSVLETFSDLPVDDIFAFLQEPPPAPGTRSVLCHTDLKGEHLYVDHASTRLTAIIDWADAEVCDPAIDLAGLTIWQGPGFVRTVAAAYGDGEDPMLAERGIWLGRVGILDYLAAIVDGRETGSIPLVIRQIQIAFNA